MLIIVFMYCWLVVLTIALGVVAVVSTRKFHIVADTLEAQTTAMQRMRESIPVPFPRYADAVIPTGNGPWDITRGQQLPDPENVPFFTQSAPPK